MITRNVKNEDFEPWKILWEGYNSFYKRTVPIEITQKTWTRFLDPEEPMHALVAELDGKLLGFATFLFHRHTARENNVCYLQDLFTDETVRGRGIGKSLILAVCEKAKAMNAPHVYWQTHETNAPARTLYDKVANHSGFVVYSMRS